MIDARANRAGQKAVAENKERAEREARLVALFHEQKEVGLLLLSMFLCAACPSHSGQSTCACLLCGALQL
jgi:hypothetical protein